jgi:hypothetical protein
VVLSLLGAAPAAVGGGLALLGSWLAWLDLPGGRNAEIGRNTGGEGSLTGG